MLRTGLQCLLQRPHASPKHQLTALAATISSSSWLLAGVTLPITVKQQPLGNAAALMQQQDLQHHATAAYSTDAVTQAQQQPDQQEQIDPNKVPDYWRPFFLNKGVSNIVSRKPAIKRPKRHQWHYCNPEYDPMDPLPQQHLPPYAPAPAFQKDYRAIYYAEKPLHHRNHYRRMWQKNEYIREQRWKQKWEKRLAASRKHDAKIQRMADRIIRHRAWEAYKADPVGYLESQDQLKQQAIDEKEEKRRLKWERHLEQKQQKKLAAQVQEDDMELFS